MRASGAMAQLAALADQCMAEYDENDWAGATWLNPEDAAYPGLSEEQRGVT